MTSSSPHAYPMHVRLAGRPVLVVGAGRVATRKIERLVESGAQVHVVALEASGIVAKLARTGMLTLNLRAVEAGDVHGKFLVIAATNDSEQNAHLAQVARSLGILVSRVDAPDDSDFTVPALARGQYVEATVSTRGAAPSASRRLGKELTHWLVQGPDRFAAELASVRLSLRGHPEATQRMRKLAEGELFEACAAGDEARIRACREAALLGVGQATGAQGPGGAAS